MTKFIHMILRGFRSSFVALFLLGAPLAFFLAACEVSNWESTDNDGDDADGDGTVGTPPTGAGVATSEYFEVTVVENVNYPTVLTKDGDGSTDCRVTASGQDLLCVLDMNELDLWFRGYQLNYTAPTGLCEYLRFHPYYYNVAPVGPSPNAVAYFVASELIVNGDPNALSADISEVVSPADDIQYRIDGTWYTHQQIYGNPATTAGDMRCPWNYEDLSFQYGEGKNCCRGKYTLYTSTDGEVDDPSRNIKWGGYDADCFEGPGIRAANAGTHPRDEFTRMPINEIVAVDDNGYSNIFKSDRRYDMTRLNIYSSNYYQIGDHAPLYSGMPVTPEPTQVAHQYFAPRGSANYRLDCLDANDEVVARIRVLVRDWNTNDEFLKFLARAAATSNEGGTENGPDQSSSDDLLSESYPDGPHNDSCDWLDLYGSGGSCSGINLFPLSSFGLDGASASTISYGGTMDYIGFSTLEEESD